MSAILDFFLHAENHLRTFIECYGPWIYALLFVIVFCETGLVVTPFLPGDSLLFAVGALAAQEMLSIRIVAPLLFCAAVLGNSTNYAIGSWIGPKVFHFESGWLFRKDYLMKAHAFYEKYGGRAITLAQFMPIVRTFAPFVAGVGSMTYKKFIAYNVFGAVLWVGIFVGGGFLFGGLPVVQKNMKLVILGIIIVSVLPIAIEFIKAKREKPKPL
jgi:membrane-associated protein